MLTEAQVYREGCNPDQPAADRLLGRICIPFWFVKLAVRLGERGKGISLPVDFLVVNTPLPYNTIMGRPTMNKIKAIISYINYVCNMRRMMAKLGRSMGINRQPGNATTVSKTP